MLSFEATQGPVELTMFVRLLSTGSALSLLLACEERALDEDSLLLDSGATWDSDSGQPPTLTPAPSLRVRPTPSPKLRRVNTRSKEQGRAARIFTTEPDPETLCPDCAWRLTPKPSVDSTQIHRDEDETAAILAELGFDTETLTEERWEWATLGAAWPGAADDAKGGGFEYLTSFYDYAASWDEGTRDLNAYLPAYTQEEWDMLLSGYLCDGIYVYKGSGKSAQSSWPEPR